jgi:murein DD-endopeptidase MepM/ murein hydrolase activator NlpD
MPAGGEHLNLLKGLAALALVVSCAGAAAQDEYPFKLETSREGGASVIRAQNQGAIPVSLRLALPVAENVATEPRFPIYMVIPARTNLTVARITQADRTKPWRYQYQSRRSFGSFEARHDPAAMYRVPWMDGRTFIIGQAPGGRITTHVQRYSREAIDVNMPEGTPIVAARGGVVFTAISAHDNKGALHESMRNKANVVRILHDDGTIGSYVHLMHDGVAVETGETVQAGKLIGYAGSTGFSAGPHLHFAITRVVRDGDGFTEVSEPITFHVGNPSYLFQPRTGMIVTANYASAGQAPKMRESRQH